MIEADSKVADSERWGVGFRPIYAVQPPNFDAQVQTGS